MKRIFVHNNFTQTRVCVEDEERERKKEREGDRTKKERKEKMGEYAHFLSTIENFENELNSEYPISAHIPTQGNLRNVAKLVEHEITKCMFIFII